MLVGTYGQTKGTAARYCTLILLPLKLSNFSIQKAGKQKKEKLVDSRCHNSCQCDILAYSSANAKKTGMYLKCLFTVTRVLSSAGEKVNTVKSNFHIWQDSAGQYVKEKCDKRDKCYDIARKDSASFAV